MSNTPQILLSSAGVLYSYKTAAALNANGALRYFYTPVYYQPTSWLYKCLNKFFGQSKWFTKFKKQRYSGQIPCEKIHSVPWFEIIQRLGRDVLSDRQKMALTTYSNDRFDRYTASKMKKVKDDFDIFYGFSGSSRACLEMNKSLGKISILEQHDVESEWARRVLQEEIELNPDFLDTIPYWPPWEPYIRGLKRENELTDFHIVPSEFARDNYIQAGYSPEKIFVNHLGIDLNHFTPASQVQKDGFKVLFAGAIGQRKGIKYLLEAFKKLNLPKSQLILAGNILGSGKPFQKYRQWFHHERYLSPVDMPDFYRSGSVFVLPSVWDALGQVVLEAMACGIPVIVSENTGGREVVRDGIDGFVVPVRDVKSLAQKLELLYENSELRQWMGRNAAIRARNFGFDSYFRNFKNIMATIQKRSSMKSNNE